MKKLVASLLLSAGLYTTITQCKTQTVAVDSLTKEAKRAFSPNTKLYIKDIPCSGANIDIQVQLICTAKVSKKAVSTNTVFFLSPIYVIRNGNNGKYTYTYEFDLGDLRDFKDTVGCKLRVITTTYPDLVSAYHTQDIKEYFFEMTPITGLFSWINFWS